MSKGVHFSGIDGQILRSPFSSSIDQVYFNPEEQVVLADIYYGKSPAATPTFIPTESYILANFSTVSGDVGGSVGPPQTPNVYTFPVTSNQYAFIIWKDLPSGSTYGSRAMNLVRRKSDKVKVSGTYNVGVYNNLQNYPPVTVVSPETIAQPQYYAKLTIGGVVYRVWKSGSPYSNASDLEVFNI